jgi:hypothetical protein
MRSDTLLDSSRDFTQGCRGSFQNWLCLIPLISGQREEKIFSPPNQTCQARVWLGREKILPSLWPLIKGIKQRQFSKLRSQPCGKSQDESNKVSDHMIRGWYCSITVANHGLIIFIRFVTQSYTYTVGKRFCK